MTLQTYDLETVGGVSDLIQNREGDGYWAKASDAEDALAEKDNEIESLRLLLSDCLDCFEDTPNIPIAIAIRKALEGRG